MKKLLYLIFILLICNHVKADVVLPEGYFKIFLKAKYPSCFYTDVNSIEWLNTSCSAITTEDSLDMSDYPYQNPGGNYLFDLEGIQYFTSLKYLDVSNHAIISSPVLPASLIYADFGNSQPSTPYAQFPSNILPNSLRYFDCRDWMTSFQSWPDSLRYLNCSNNAISPMPALPSHLETLICFTQESYAPLSNILGVLPPLPATLIYLNCGDNALGSLPVLPASLKYLDCTGNNVHTNPETISYTLAELPSLPEGLETLKCGRNKLTALPPLPSSLKYLDCSVNRVFLYEIGNPATYTPNTVVYEGINVLPALPASLQYLNCSYNKLSSLPALPASLTYLNCSYNIYPGYDPLNLWILFPQPEAIASLQPLPPQLDTLMCSVTQVHCIPRIPATLTYLVVDREKVTCLPNSGAYTVEGGPIPLCNIFNNSNGCQSTGIVSGNIFYDNNSNGAKDAGENYRPDVEVQLSNGQYGYTSDSGYYELSADPGNYTLSVVAPTLYVAAPSTINYSLSSYDTIVHEMIALQPTVMLDSMTVSLVPLYNPRPGFGFGYKLTYANVGTTVVSPAVVLNYDNANLSYTGSSNAAVINNGNNLSLTEANFLPGTLHNFTAGFDVNPAATPGDTLRANAIITAGTCTAKDSALSIFVASFDPNDKSATPVLTLQQVASGTDINYIVRFQNTGTAAAMKIVITDTLSSFLDPSTFRMVDASHNCKTTRIGNTVAFEFLNIQLPDSNTNEPASHGFIRFAVKPFTTAAVNSVIPNRASIYFDFNAPIVTNIANTKIELTTVPLTLLSFKAVNSTNNTAFLYWSTANEFNTAFFDIEQSTDNRNFTRIGTTAALGRGSNSYTYKTTMAADIVYYRLKMTDFDGRFAYSQVIEVRKNKDAGSIVVLSNPAKNTLSIIMTDESLVNTTAAIFNQQGVLVQKFVLKDGLQAIDVSKLSTGVYYLKTAVTTKKIIVSH